MNKSSLKKFATNARLELLEKVELQARRIGITADSIKQADIESSDAVYIDGRLLSNTERNQRNKLISRIEEIGFNRVMEETAYTWFNRFIALRYMEVNDYLPTRVRVLSSETASVEPDMMKEALTLDLELDKEKVYEYKFNNKTDELFKYLIKAHCNDLNRYMPFMFENVESYTEILFPEGLLGTDSFVRQMTDTNFIPEHNWKNVEVIGWLYQYYIIDEKERVFKADTKYKAEDIPFATQLFTPKWIVQYMVQNSLGKYWIEAHPEHKDLIDNWDFYINKNSDHSQENCNYSSNKELKIENIKCLDPAMGSGHILVYMFDVLYEIYSHSGYLKQEIPRLIIENNLYGLDIDDRAYQLASFSLIMKALQFDKRFLKSIESEDLIMNLTSIQETNYLNDDFIAYVAGVKEGSKFDSIKYFFEQFIDAKTIGSLLKVQNIDLTNLKKRYLDILENPARNIFETEKREQALSMLPQLFKQMNILDKKYDVLAMNPPYIGSKFMNKELTQYLIKQYPDSKSDIFAAFMDIDHLIKPQGIYTAINQHSWMFLSSFEKIRKKIINNKYIESMIHIGPRAFEEVSGEVVQSTVFVLRNNKKVKNIGIYLRLIDFNTSVEKMNKALESINNTKDSYVYKFDQEDLNKIAGSPIAYWSTRRIRELYNGEDRLDEIAEPKTGIQTGKNKEFLRYWYEVSELKIGFNMQDFSDIKEFGFKWYPYNKGGEFRKWYGNNNYVINMENEGEAIANFSKKNNYRLRNPRLYFKEAITWSFVSSSNFGVRYSPPGFLFDVAGSSVFPQEKDSYYLTAFLCSKVAFELLKYQNPTLNFQVENISRLPIIQNLKESNKIQLDTLTKMNIKISKEDWDYYETSWEFKKHPLLRFKNSSNSIFKSLSNWEEYSNNQFDKLKENEETINKIFIEIYQLEDEMKAEIKNQDVTIQKSHLEIAIPSFISYFIGCSLGRYSLDEDGLIFAGGRFNTLRYKTYSAKEDNIIPILSSSYFEDDIVSRFSDFIRVTFSEETLGQNLDFIADTIGRRKNETAKEALRRYFLNDFYKNHIQMYNKRPIYWLFTSGKEKAFNCLVYMHRYDKTTLSRIRTDYLHEVQTRMDSERNDLLSIINGDYTTKEINQAKKDLKPLERKIDELIKYDELLHNMADQQIEIDLDDGVQENYDNFKGLIAKM